MRVTICDTRKELGRLAAQEGASYIAQAIEERGEANVVFVTGKSQVETLLQLARQNVKWECVNVFHLDEFVGLPADSLSTSRYFLGEFLLGHIGKVKSYTPIDTSKAKLERTVKDLNALMKNHRLDVAFICIGENGHLAFNDPPADLDATDPYILVDLERRSRRQQVGEGWFKSIDDVPQQAITMSIHEILSARNIICACPEQRKAKAVAMCVYDDMGPAAPCAALKRKTSCDIFLDRQSSCLIMGDKRNF